MRLSPHLFEPSLYSFAAFSSVEETSKRFELFEACCRSLVALLELNHLRIRSGALLREVTREVYPYAVLAAAERKQGRREDLASYIVRKLDTRIVQVEVHDLRHDEIESMQPSLLSQGLYADPDLDTVWRDLLVRALRASDDWGAECIIGAPPELSAFSSLDPPSLRKIKFVGGDEQQVQVFRLLHGTLPPDLVDPAAHASLLETSRTRGLSECQFIWEGGTGNHKVPRSIIKVLERTAESARCKWFTTQMRTSKWMQRTPCRLTPDSDVAYITYYISDGSFTMQGKYKTLAGNAAEQRVALALLSQEFVEQCRDEKLLLR